MTISCDCLNIKLKIENLSAFNSLNASLLSEEDSHPYFQKELYQTERILESSEIFSALVRNFVVGSWNISQCFICKRYTHGTNYVTGIATFSADLKELPTNILTYSHELGYLYSPAFKLFLPPELDASVLYEDSSDVYSEISVVGESLRLIKSCSSSFIEKTHCMDQSGKSCEKWRERALMEERYLAALLVESEVNNVELSSSQKSDMSVGRGLLTEEMSPSGRCVTGTILDVANENIYDSCEDEELRDMLCDLKISNSKSPIYEMPEEEGIFDMDEEFDSGRQKGSPGSSASHFSEDEDSASPDHEPSISSRRFPSSSRDYLAKSAPLNVPAWPRCLEEKEIDIKKPYCPEDIASSIKRLARSVRTSSVDAFGELPRATLPSHF